MRALLKKFAVVGCSIIVLWYQKKLSNSIGFDGYDLSVRRVTSGVYFTSAHLFILCRDQNLYRYLLEKLNDCQ